MRRREPIDPALERELAALDAALPGEAAAGVDAELAAIVRDVRAVAPRFEGPARTALDARVADGFPAPPRRRWRRPVRLRPDRRALLPAAGAVAAVLVGIVVVGGSGGGDGARTGGGSPPAAEQARPGASGGARAGGGAGTSSDRPAAAPVPAPSAVVPPVPSVPVPATGRRVERDVRLALRTSTGRFDAVTDGVVRTTQRAGGFVADSEVRRTGARGTATFVLRIPSARLRDAIAGLSRLAHVRSIEQSSEDLTGAHDATASRLADARTRRRALVAALATATGTRAARLRARLADVTARRRSLERALRALDRRTSYATVDLTVTAARPAAATERSSDTRFTPAAAWRDALRGLEIAAGVAIIALALGLPLALAGGLAVAAAGAVRRRRREAALDAA